MPAPVNPSPSPTEDTRKDDGRSLLAWVLGILLLLLPALIVYLLIALWPRTEISIRCEWQQKQVVVPQAAAAGPPETVEEKKQQWAPCASIPPFVEEFRLSADVRLLLLVLLAGLLGAYVHAAQSFASYMGNQKFRRQWAWWYILRLPVGGVLALFVYFTARGGLLTGTTPTSKTDDLNIFGIMTFAALAGLFSKQVVDKLAEVFSNFFKSSQDDQRKDKLEGGEEDADARRVAGGTEAAGSATDSAADGQDAGNS
jgi:hypothetical protein